MESHLYNTNLLPLLIHIFGRDSVYRDLDPKKLQLRTCIVDSSLLLPHEGVEKSRLELLIKVIERSGYVKHPITVDVRTFIILDGHHRFKALEELGIKYVPVFFVDYVEEYVDVKPFRKDIHVSKYSVISKVYIEKGVYPPRTTRHIFSGILLPTSYIQLETLRELNGKSNPLLKIPSIICPTENSTSRRTS
ncbi:MAG: ParB N-terminal domain-containing protein [Sulfolobales archaeon]